MKPGFDCEISAARSVAIEVSTLYVVCYRQTMFATAKAGDQRLDRLDEGVVFTQSPAGVPRTLKAPLGKTLLGPGVLLDNQRCNPLPDRVMRSMILRGTEDTLLQ